MDNGLHCHFMVVCDFAEDVFNAYLTKLCNGMNNISLEWFKAGDMSDMLEYILKNTSYNWYEICGAELPSKDVEKYVLKAGSTWYIAQEYNIQIFRHPKTYTEEVRMKPKKVPSKDVKSKRMIDPDKKTVETLDELEDIKLTLDYFKKNTSCGTVETCKKCPVGLWLAELERRDSLNLPYIKIDKYINTLNGTNSNS